MSGGLYPDIFRKLELMSRGFYSIFRKPQLMSGGLYPIFRKKNLCLEVYILIYLEN